MTPRRGKRAPEVKSPELRLLEQVTERTAQDAVTWTGDGPAVLLSVAAHGVYGRLTGLDRDQRPVTATGYVTSIRELTGGLGGGSHKQLLVVDLVDAPDGPVTATVQTETDVRITVLEPPEGMPPGAGFPWFRMPVEHQILSARGDLGLSVQVVDGPYGPLWRVDGCPHQLTEDVAGWLFGGPYGSWERRVRAVFSPERIQEAITDGRIDPDGNRWPMFGRRARRAPDD